MLGSEWEDMVILLTEEEAIQASLKYPHCTVAIFQKNKKRLGYWPIYDYYENGKLIKASE